MHHIFRVVLYLTYVYVYICILLYNSHVAMLFSFGFMVILFATPDAKKKNYDRAYDIYIYAAMLNFLL